MTQPYTYDGLCSAIEFITYDSSTPVTAEGVNPLIERFVTRCGATIPAVGGHSALLLTPEGIAAKICFKPGDERLQIEQNIFSQLEESPSPHIIRCLLSRSDIVFMPYIGNKTLIDRIADDNTRPILSWMFQLTSAVAKLESLGLAHGDIKPLNIIIDDQDRLTLIDLDHALPVGGIVEVGYEPYVRVHMGEEGGGVYGSAGAETELFALGSIFYYMTRGTELYAELSGFDQVNTLMARKYPVLSSDDPIDSIITRCWENKFARVADLLNEVKRVAAEQGVLDSISSDGLMSCSEYTAKRKLCEHYYSLIVEDSVGVVENSVTVFEDSVSQSVESTITKQQSVCKDVGYSGWQEKVFDVASYLRKGFKYGGSFQVTLTITVSIGAAMVFASYLRRRS